MLKKNLINLLLIIIIFIAGVIFGMNINVDQKVFNENENDENIAEENNSAKITVSLMMDYGNGVVKTYNDIKISQDESVFSLLQKISRENDLELGYNPPKDSLGVFVDSVGGVANDSNNNKWWIYWVNNKMGMVAADRHILQDGDIVEWKYGVQVDFE